MRAYALAGDRPRALVQFERLAAVLEAELATRPDAATLALAQAIRSEEPLPPEDLVPLRPG
jgi:hypothetical protein